MSSPRLSAAELAARHGLKRAGREWRGRCPACGYPNGLSITERNGAAVWWCASCRDQPAVTRALLGAAAAAPAANAVRVADAGDRRALALRIWQAAAPAIASPVARYLAGRGLTLPEGAPLRFDASAKHPSGRRVGCMLALLHDADGKPAAIHRTFLAPGGEGKAALEPVRMTLGPVAGGAVRLWPAVERLAVAEGIETTLAAAALLGMPAWAAVSAGNLGDSLALPAAVREVVIAADHDAPGRAAAERATKRWRAEGRRVRVAMPDREGADFNDILLNRVRNDA
jgi:putative DNA primase/helicase